MQKLDLSPQVEQWASEEVIILYRSPLDRKVHRYFPDFWVKFTNKKVVIIEVKPNRETKPPKKREKSRKFINEAKKSKVKRLIYLGGLGTNSENLSPHLESRKDISPPRSPIRGWIRGRIRGWLRG